MIQQAIAYHQQGRLDDAERLYGLILQTEHDHFDALHLLGVLMHQRGQCEAALNLIAKALTINSQSADACANQARVFAALGRYEEALASYDSALALQPAYVEALYDRAKILHRLNRYGEALASYDGVLALRPNEPAVLNERGVILHALRRYDEALASCDRALALRPDYAEAFYNRGNILSELGHFDEALASYDGVLALQPNDTEALHNRGLALQEKNNRGITLPKLRKTKDIATRYAGFYINLDRSAARRALIEGEISRCNLQSFYKRFPAADGNSLGFPNQRLTSGEIGCFTSHYLLLKQNCESSHHLHVVEDDVVFSHFTAQAIESALSSGAIDRFDLLFTDTFTMHRDYRRYKALYDQSLERDETGAISVVQPHVIAYIAATTSYIINRHSIPMLVELLERELTDGPRDPLDLVIRKAASEGKIRVGCLFPFVTTLRIDEIAGSTIAGRNKDPMKTLALGLGRYSFFVDCDHEALNARATRVFASNASHSRDEFDTDVHRQLLDRIQEFSSTDDGHRHKGASE